MKCSRCGKIPPTGNLHFNMPNTDGVCGACLDAKPALPVRVGDMVRRNENGLHGESRSVWRVYETCAEIGQGRYSACIAWDRIEHVDGAPIDVEASLRIARGEDSERTNGALKLEQVDHLVNEALAADLEAARKRIAELEATVSRLANIGDDVREYARRYIDETQRANRLSDEAGSVRTERDDLLRENAVLRRKLEATERKAAKR